MGRSSPPASCTIPSSQVPDPSKGGGMVVPKLLTYFWTVFIHTSYVGAIASSPLPLRLPHCSTPSPPLPAPPLPPRPATSTGQHERASFPLGNLPCQFVPRGSHVLVSLASHIGAALAPHSRARPCAAVRSRAQSFAQDGSRCASVCKQDSRSAPVRRCVLLYAGVR
jgi:hypothetical protein